MAGKSSVFKTATIAAVVAVAVSMVVCPRSRPRPIATFIGWVVRLVPVVPFFFEDSQEGSEQERPYESQHMLANQDPEPRLEGGQVVLNHGHGW